MNPDGTNPATNTGAGASTGGAVVPPALDFTSSDTTNLSMADSLASAADNLTSAGMAAKESDNGSIEMGEIGASDPSATMERPDEPLIPAAPVPGSIGSVTSGPAVATSDATTSAPGFGPAPSPTAGPTFGASNTSGSNFGSSVNGFGAGSSASGFGGSAAPSFGAGTPASTSPATSNPFGGSMGGATPAGGSTANGGPASVSGTSTSSASAPVAPKMSEPYNPFAAKMGSSTVMPTSSTNVPAGSQPATEKFSSKMARAKKPSMLTVILGILAVVSLVMAIVFAVLWQQALANEKIDYVPPVVDEGNVNQTVSMITCTKDLGADMIEAMPGLTGHTLAATANFSGDQLRSITMLSRYTFTDAVLAEAIRPTFDATMAWYGDVATALGLTPITSTLAINDVTVNLTATATPEQLMGDYIDVFALTADEDGKVDGSRESIQANYEANGFVCVED